MSFDYAFLDARATPNQFENCTFATCELSTSFWYYRPSLPANAIFLSLFSLSLLLFLVTYTVTRRFGIFTFTLIACCSLEILGYLGRVLSYSNPWHETGFLLQIVCLTIAPSFMAGGIYLCLRNIVYAFGPENSRIKPETYTRFFIPCDVISLVLQALGGGMASTASHEGRSSALGDHIMVTGLAFQVLTLAVFMGICLDFAFRTARLDAVTLDPKFSSLRSSKKFRGFLASLTLSTLCIFVRSVYRVAELSEGWTGHLIQQEWLFVGLEGVMVVVAVVVLNAFHPAFCFNTGFESRSEEEIIGFFQRRFQKVEEK
ncbi:hypothetical protein G7Y89_g12481 [Cudoniella acicularis]|uniref:Sphingoid long-chain base transporter RSB1 n=1 Tax=Cudoniella acicularis TaxID=354080 RepID=A0A8H4RB48_9HELO|nr:hypothetical protein G7Y89_g12481 [Cudoniella acicularis]